MTHELKTWPSSFEAIRNGTKTCEIRPADRPFEIGDYLFLREWEPSQSPRSESAGVVGYTGRALRVRITHVIPAGAWGLPGPTKTLGRCPGDSVTDPGICALSIQVVS